MARVLFYARVSEMAFRCVFFGNARFPLLSVALVALVACGSIEERCRSKYGASEAAYDQCVERQHAAVQRMLRDQRRDTQSIPDFP